jgi:hypothetical protein
MSCKILDVTEEITFEVDMIVDEAEASFDVTELLDALAESETIEEYKDLIKKIEILKVEYKLLAFNGPANQQINTATVDVGDAQGNGSVLLATVTNENLQALLTTTKELELNEEGANRLEELILDPPHSALFHYYGGANTAPLDFTVRFFVTVKMTANPL